MPGIGFVSHPVFSSRLEENAVRYLELTTPEEREALRQCIEQQAVQLGNDMLKIRS